MKITVTGKNIAVNDKINDAIDKKFAKIGKFFADDIQAKVLMHPEKAKVKVEATISGKGNIFRAESAVFRFTSEYHGLIIAEAFPELSAYERL